MAVASTDQRPPPPRAATVSQEVLEAVNLLAVCSSQTPIDDLCEAFDKVRDWSLTDPKRKQELASAGLIRATIKLMICLPQDASLQAKAAGILWLLAREQQYRAVIEQHGGVLAVLDCMKRHKENARVQSTACGVLWNLAANNESTRVWIALSGGITTILMGMKRHARCAKVQAAGFSVLMNLASDNDPNRDVIISFDGISLVLLAMRRYPQHPLLQAAGCALFNNLSANNKHVAAVWEAGSVEAILGAMRRHPRHSPVQAYGCAALQNLASEAEYRRQIGLEGGILLILEAVRHCSREAEVVSYGCAALHNIAFKNPANQTQIVNANGIEIILKSMRKHERNGKVQTSACGALCNILTTRERRRRANALGAFKTATRILDIHVLNQQVQTSASVLLDFTPTLEDEVYGMAESCTMAVDYQCKAIQQDINNSNNKQWSTLDCSHNMNYFVEPIDDDDDDDQCTFVQQEKTLVCMNFEPPLFDAHLIQDDRNLSSSCMNNLERQAAAAIDQRTIALQEYTLACMSSIPASEPEVEDEYSVDSTRQEMSFADTTSSFMSSILAAEEPVEGDHQFAVDASAQQKISFADTTTCSERAFIVL